jgi:predicted phage replisome organizer
MATVQWIKLTVDMFDDQKIRVIEIMPSGKNILLVWIKLLTLAGKKNDLGRIYIEENIPYTREVLASLLNEDILVIDLALKTLNDLRMIDIDEAGIIEIRKWEYHQNIEGMKKLKEQWKSNSKKYRDKKKAEPILLSENNDESYDNHKTSYDASCNVIQQNKKKNKKENKKIHITEFVSLTEEEQTKLIEEHGKDKFDRMITVLNTYKGASGKTYKSDYMAILNWVVKRVEEDMSKQRPNQRLNIQPKRLVSNMDEQIDDGEFINIYTVMKYDDGTEFRELYKRVPKF